MLTLTDRLTAAQLTHDHMRVLDTFLTTATHLDQTRAIYQAMTDTVSAFLPIASMREVDVTDKRGLIDLMLGLQVTRVATWFSMHRYTVGEYLPRPPYGAAVQKEIRWSAFYGCLGLMSTRIRTMLAVHHGIDQNELG